ncbi:unnamed protein product [Acanthoscelides obtectus]|uniref:Uncharacterized protein n=1 Tax=Acanthoscelides obtectus TaxID=200917 RepID=A0A9P0KM62_ACAOB|nr:unnamed protein product [Acanthoscelides obtectus]CAK1667682.1 hypothetical protein AOBTE_LOCUS25986 [Acanthoscelides obtectus]
MVITKPSDAPTETPKNSKCLRTTNEELKQEIKIFCEKVNSYSQLLIEKDRLIEQLVNENTRFQDQLNLLSANITEKETVVGSLKKLNTSIDIIEKSSMTSTSYSQIVKKTYATNSKEIPLKSIVIIPSQQQKKPQDA